MWLCIYDRETLRLLRPVLKPGHLSSTVAQRFVDIAFTYFDNFKEAPCQHFDVEFELAIARVPIEAQHYWTTYRDKVRCLRPPNAEYVLTRLSDYIKTQELNQAVLSAAQLLSQGNLPEAQSILGKAIKMGVDRVELGLDYLYDLSDVMYRGEVANYLMTTGIPHLDHLIGGYQRKQLLCFMGAYKGKKSWSLIHLGRQAMLSGLNVVHITHEMSSREVETRYDMSFGSLCKPLQYTLEPQAIPIITWKGMVSTRSTVLRPTVYDVRAVREARESVTRFGGRLFIKKYAMGQATISDIRALLNFLEMERGFEADVVINDYADIMLKPGKTETRDFLNDAYIAHKGLADERNCLVVTASQARREAIRKSRISMGDFAEDIRKAANVDIGIAICQDEEQAKQQWARLYVIANRDGPMDVSADLIMNLDLGQFCYQSMPAGSLSHDLQGDEDATTTG